MGKIINKVAIVIEYESELCMEEIRRIQIECAVRRMLEDLAERNLLRNISTKIEHQQPK